MTTKRALIISGGGAKGAFAAGALKYLMVDHRDQFPVDLVVGSSVGALLAPMVCTGDIQSLLTLFENGRTRDILAPRNRILAYLFKRNALTCSSPLERMIRQLFDRPGWYERLLNSPTEMMVVTVNLRTGRLVMGSQRQDDKATLIQKMLASASVPFLMPPVTIGGDQYVDAGVKEICPIQTAIDAGATHIVAVLLRPRIQNRAPRPGRFQKATSVLKRALELLVDETVDSDVKIATLYSQGCCLVDRIKENARKLGLTTDQQKALFRGADNPFASERVEEITIIRPDFELSADLLKFEPTKMREYIDLGYQTAERIMVKESRLGIRNCRTGNSAPNSC